MLKMSIITVCYNAGNTIADTLASVQNQTYKNIEHIVVDGGSTDNSIEIIANNEKYLSKFISERDDGLYYAMNKGIKLASGDVVAFLNADDFYKDNTVIEMVANVMHSEHLDALYGDVEFFRPGQRDSVIRRYNSARFTADRLGWGWMPAHPALFVRRVLFERYGMFSTDYRIAGDFEFIVRIFKHPELGHRHLPKSLVCMQMGGISTSGWRATLQINREMLRACRANGIQTNWMKMLVRYPLKALEFFRTVA